MAGACAARPGGNSVITGQRWNDPPDAPQPLNSIDRNRSINLVLSALPAFDRPIAGE